MSFQPTRWSLIRTAVEHDDRASTETLCRVYRPPTLAYIRRHGHPSDAEDLTQEFFARVVLSRGLYARADPAQGRFRHYLLSALKHFLISEGLRGAAQKRGAGASTLSLDQGDVTLCSHRIEDDPERAFQRDWALAVIASARARLANETTRSGHQDLFLQLQPLLYDSVEASDYDTVGATLHMRPNTVAVAMHRLRLRMRQLIREELAATVANDDDIDAELTALREILAEPD